MEPTPILAAGEFAFRLEPGDPAPVYVQLERLVRMAVADGTLQPGDPLPTVRQLARDLGVAPSTTARAYAELAREGVIRARAGAGSEIAPRDQLDHEALQRSRSERLQTLARQVAVRGLALGLEPAEIVGAVRAELASRGRPAPAEGPVPAPLGDGEVPLLSSRNRLRGTVVGVRAGEVLAEVTIAIDDHGTLVAAVTRSSLDRLGLTEGAAVSAYVKATSSSWADEPGADAPVVGAPRGLLGGL